MTQTPNDGDDVYDDDNINKKTKEKGHATKNKQ